MSVPLLLAAILATAACTSPPAGSGPNASAADASGTAQPDPPSSQQPSGSQDGGEVPTDFPPACEVLTADELAAIVGNPLADGTGFTSLVCEWESEFDETSVSLLLQPIPASVCADGLPEGEPTDQFGAPATVLYDFAGNIPGAQVGVCVEAGLVLVTITGGIDAASDEARYTGEAIEVMQLVLGRL